MKNLVFILVCCLFCSAEGMAQKLKVACIGNSITYGSGVAGREHNAYPAQLQAILGEGYEVRNFGVSGTTTLSSGDWPYVNTQQYKEALAFNPDVVFIKLGTNDSKLENRVHLSDFEKDYTALIQTFRELPSHPRIILLTPVAAHTGADTLNITASVIAERIVPMIERIAYQNDLEIINLQGMFAGYDESQMPDGIHPSSLGAGRIAVRLYEHLQQRDSGFDFAAKLPAPLRFTAFHGYKCILFKNNGVDCKVVVPKKAASGNPWIWRARFWEHEPQTDIALLERGFHLVYCDVADLFGAPSAVKRWNDFYALMNRAGLNKKAVLEGMSRGGLIVYRWAAENPSKVACVYADAPVLDLKSWPLGAGTGKQDAEVVQAMLKAYGFASVEEAMQYGKNPLDQAAKIAKGGYPILHVCGGADDVVPVSENTDKFEKTVLQSGGKIRVIRKAEVNHHPHSLKDPERIVNFILRATHRKFIPTVVAAPGNEYRSGAGWKEGNDWMSNHEEIRQLAAKGNVDVLLVGNSITQGFGGARRIVTHNPGEAALNQALAGKTWLNAGISGDRTQHVLWRLQHGGYEKANPRYILLSIGVNNLISGGDTGEETARGILACVNEIKKRFPDSRLIVFGTLPAGNEPTNYYRQEIEKIHRILAKDVKGKNVYYYNPTSWFVLQDGTLDPTLFIGDGIHLNNKGYGVWCQKIKELIR